MDRLEIPAQRIDSNDPLVTWMWRWAAMGGVHTEDVHLVAWAWDVLLHLWHSSSADPGIPLLLDTALRIDNVGWYIGFAEHRLTWIAQICSIFFENRFSIAKS